MVNKNIREKVERMRYTMDVMLDTILRQLNYISEKVENLESNMNQKFQEQDEKMERKFREQDEKMERRFQEQEENWNNIFQKHKKEIDDKLNQFSKEVSIELKEVLEAVNRRNDHKFDEIVGLIRENQKMLQDHEKRILNLENHKKHQVAIL